MGFLLRHQKASNEIPGPPGLPFLGALQQLRRDPLTFVLETAREYPSIARIDLGFDELLFVSEPAAVEHVLATNARNYRKSRFYERLEPFFGQSLFTTNGEEWLHQRRVAQPAFAMAALVGFVGTIVEETDRFTASWKNRSDPLDVAEELMQLGLRIAFRTLFDEALDDGTAARMHKALSVFLRWGERRVWSMTTFSAKVPTAHNRQFQAARREVIAIMMQLIEARRKAARLGDDLLSRILRSRHSSGRAYSDFEVCLQASSVLLAGHETGAAALAWTLFLLSGHPDAAATIRAEVAAVCGSRITPAHVQRFTFTGMVFQESMRLYPPIWTLSREALRDDEICGFRLPAGSVVMASPFSMHRDGRFWNDPEVFDPGRFNPARLDDRPLYAYFPFGGGPRKCIGHRFAFIEGVIILAMLASRFRFEVSPGHVVEMEPMISLRPKRGMLMNVRPVGDETRDQGERSESAPECWIANDARRTMVRATSHS